MEELLKEINWLCQKGYESQSAMEFLKMVALRKIENTLSIIESDLQELLDPISPEDNEAVKKVWDKLLSRKESE